MADAVHTFVKGQLCSVYSQVMGLTQCKERVTVRCFADLVRAVQPVPEGLHMDFLRASSYTGAATTGQDAVEMGLVSKIPIQGRHILLVEDIIDTGKTLQVIYEASCPDST